MMRVHGSRGEVNRVARRRFAPTVFGVAAIAALAFVGGPTSTARAQESTDQSRPQQAAPAPAVPPPLQELGLTDDQLSAVQSVLEAYREAGESGDLWQSASEIREILEPEQIAMLEERLLEAPIVPRAGRGRPAGPPGGPPERPGGRVRGPDGDRPLHRGPGVGPEFRFGSLEGLDLSDEQRAEVAAIRETFGPRMREIGRALRDGSLSEEEADAKFEAVRDSIHSAVLQVLTPEQQALLEEHRAAAEARRQAAEARQKAAQARREARRDSARARFQARAEGQREAMIEALDLSEAQIAALDSIQAELRGAAEALRMNSGRPSPAELTALREARHADLMGILDEAQRETWVVHAALARMEMRRRAGGRGFREPARPRSDRSGR